MKTAVIFLFAFLILIVLILTTLHMLEIWSIWEHVQNSFRSHPLIESYLKTEEEVRELYFQIDELTSEKDNLQQQLAIVTMQLEQARNTITSQQTEIAALEEQAQQDQDLLINREERIRQLAAIYGQMRADAAAESLEELSNDLIIELLFFWENRFAAQVLSAINPQRAAQIARQISE